jgi:choline monooxygenase
MSEKSQKPLLSLLNDIDKIATSPQDAATSMPPEVYTSADLLTLERELIFAKEWICLGREDELPSPGNYFTDEINNVPIIIVRDVDMELRALVNVCRHRMAKIAEGEGKARLFICPYHSWSYDLKGKLVNAPDIENKRFDKPNCRLPQLRLEVWLGFVYVNLDTRAAPLAPRLDDLKKLTQHFHIEKMRSVWKKTVYWKANWKVLVENFLESYHISVVHKDTLLPYGGAELVKLLESGDAYSFYLQGQEKSEALFEGIISPDVLIKNSALGDFERFNTPVGCIFPSHLMSISWFGVLWLSLQPVSTGELRADWGVIGPVKGLPINAESYSEYSFPNWIDAVNNEDKPRVEAVQSGAESGYADVGPLHATHEKTILEFIRYLSRQLSDRQ